VLVGAIDIDKYLDTVLASQTARMASPPIIPEVAIARWLTAGGIISLQDDGQASSPEIFLRLLPTKWRRKPAGIDMERIYVTVTLRISFFFLSLCGE